MKLQEIREFAEQCYIANIKMNKRHMKFICSDWDEVIPEEMQNFREVEMNHRIGDDMVTLMLVRPKNSKIEE